MNDKNSTELLRRTQKAPGRRKLARCKPRHAANRNAGLAGVTWARGRAGQGGKPWLDFTGNTSYCPFCIASSARRHGVTARGSLTHNHGAVAVASHPMARRVGGVSPPDNAVRKPSGAEPPAQRRRPSNTLRVGFRIPWRKHGHHTSSGGAVAEQCLRFATKPATMSLPRRCKLAINVHLAISEAHSIIGGEQPSDGLRYRGILRCIKAYCRQGDLHPPHTNFTAHRA